VQHELGEGRRELRLVSISIDPEHDTPARLATYAERQRAREPWSFLTGEPTAIRTVQEAFRAYRGNKMNHVPLTFLRASPDDPWLRIQGFATAADLVREYHGLVGD
jgi:protein SCO1/2